MKQLLTLSIILLSFAAKGQTIQPAGSNTQLLRQKGGIESVRYFRIPMSYDPFTNYTKEGMLWYDSTGNKHVYYRTNIGSFYFYNAHEVDSLFSTAVTGVTQETLDDSCNAIRSDFPTGGNADSSIFATVYDVDTAKQNLRAADALKLNISDTASMLSGYTRLTRFLDSISAVRGAIPNVSGYLPFTDTANMLLGYTRVNRFLDSLTAHWAAIQGKQAQLNGTGLVRMSGTTVSYDNTSYGTGSVTSFTVTPSNGVSGVVTNPTTTPAVAFTLGNITPTSVAASSTVTGSNLSGTNTGDQTITLTGDVTGSGTGSFAATLKNTGTAGTYGDATHIPSVTTDAQGRVTGVTTYTFTSGGVQSLTSTGSTLTFTGTSTVNGEINLSHANTWQAVQTFSVAPVFSAGIASATATTQSANDNSTKVATTAYVDGAGANYMTWSSVNSISTTSYTLQASDRGKIVAFSSNSAITLTVPTSLGSTFFCTIQQNGTGQITFTASGTTLRVYGGGTKTAGQYAMAVINFTPTTDTYNIQGATQ